MSQYSQQAQGFVLVGQYSQPGSYGPPRAALPTSTIELSVKCTDLVDMDVFSKSDPLCVMFQKSSNGQWYEIGRTEMIKECLSPEWQKKFVVDYSFEERQIVKFEVFDWDMNSNNLSDHDFLGRVECSLGSIVSAPGKQFVSVIRDAPKSNKGKVFVSAEELAANKEVVQIKFAAEKLDKKDLFGKSDPFFIVYKSMPNGQWTVVYRSEVIKNDLNPTWKPMNVSVRELCNADYDRPLKVEVFDWDSDGSHDLIGIFTTDLKALSIALVEQKTFNVINPKKQQKKSSYKNSGVLRVKQFNKETQATFLDYIQGGTAMNFSVAVDFTASNGDPNHPRSLHYRNPQGENQYTTAIRSVGEIIQDYDSDKQFPALGFGARVPPSGQVSHEFFLNLRQDNPYCQGVDGLMQAYYTSLQNVSLYGPTNFSPVINHVAKFAQAYQDGRQYFVLLIITDGIITDMDNTMSSIVAASSLPMSIIIVGVGEEDFSAMEELDCDGKLMRSHGRVAARDIVQFVEMRKFVGRDGRWNKEMLAKEVLAEIPNQVVGWMKIRGVKPVNT